MGKFASAKAGGMTTAFIRWFIKQYRIDMSEAVIEEPTQFETFNDFFTRELKPGLRTFSDDAQEIGHPADARVSQLGAIEQGQLIQAKGHSYSALTLLGGDYRLADTFADGQFATLYLSPSDYHRVHMPMAGTLRQMIYVPGDLFSVNPLTAENVPDLFARNERVVCIFDTAIGPMAQVLVGATIVGSIETVWAGTITPQRRPTIHKWDYPAAGEEGAITLEKGQEMGRFKLGSTVINLFPKDTISFDESLAPGIKTSLGTPYARIQTN
ncbi:archaetidylserine decarboxylase [Vibrio stylophorae]|nr:archaetidylserine decarboxylase [Vibrio stylophorae]